MMEQRLVNTWDYFYYMLSEIVTINDNGFYNDGSQLLSENSSGKKIDSIKKILFKLFKKLVFDITVETGLKTIKFLNDKLKVNDSRVAL